MATRRSARKPAKRATKRREPVEHHVTHVEIDGDEVRAVCACGWVSAEHESETDARLEHDMHANAERDAAGG